MARLRQHPSPASERRRAPRSDATRNTERLLAAARELFEERGPNVSMDKIAQRAGVGNATLYRRFPSRSEVLVAVYSDEVKDLCRRGDELLDSSDPDQALFTWLDAFVEHVASKRDLALAATQGSADRRSELFHSWHSSMIATASRLLLRAQKAGTVRTGVTATEVLALANALVLATADTQQAQRMMRYVREGIQVQRK